MTVTLVTLGHAVRTRAHGGTFQMTIQAIKSVFACS